ncbi:MAG: hypothetical protein ACOZNI_22240 [Myxococcota bacterium]
MPPRLRKLVLTAHVAASVGWLGAVLAYLALAVTGVASEDALLARAAYVSMERIAMFVLVPFSFAALLTGLAQALGTEWGVFRHYWVLVKLVLTAVGTLVLLGHMRAVSRMSEIAGDATTSLADFEMLRHQLVVHAAGGLIVLLTATALSVYKPWGRIRWSRTDDVVGGARTPWGLYVLLGVAGLVLLRVLLHLVGGGMPGH